MILETLQAVKNRSESAKKQETKYRELLSAKSDLDSAWRNFNEVTESSYIDIAILKLNLAKRRFEVLIEEAKKENVCLETV
jgi:hypothetical protein